MNESSPPYRIRGFRLSARWTGFRRGSWRDSLRAACACVTFMVGHIYNLRDKDVIVLL